MGMYRPFTVVGTLDSVAIHYQQGLIKASTMRVVASAAARAFAKAARRTARYAPLMRATLLCSL